MKSNALGLLAGWVEAKWVKSCNALGLLGCTCTSPREVVTKSFEAHVSQVATYRNRNYAHEAQRAPLMRLRRPHSLDQDASFHMMPIFF